MQAYKSDIAFTPQVKREQEKRGSRDGYQRMVERNDWADTVTDDLYAFLQNANSFYLATATADGQPYIQHRGGPKGFLKVLDNKTLAFADFAGNKQYVSTGNLAENDKAYIFIMDYAGRRRVKLWGRARIVEDDPELLEKLTDPTYKGRPERVFVFEIAAWDRNCPQHIPQKVDVVDVQQAIGDLQARIAALEEENAELKTFLGKSG
ncbi:MAG: pyridoxamine 5'-phosphate oxidase family protein [Pseudomonadota bacterium]